MALVYIVASAPWGPLKIETAADYGELRHRVSVAPAHVEDVGDLDPSQVLATARAGLPAADASGLIATTVAKAVARLVEARRRVSATPVAEHSVEAAPEAALSHGDGVADDAVPEPAASASTLGKLAKNSEQPARTRTGLEHYPRIRPFTDVREIRKRLGLSQGKFARAFGISLQTIQDWEQGRSKPDQAVRSYLHVIELRPDMVREILASAS